jgi:hypothetical protein
VAEEYRWMNIQPSIEVNHSPLLSNAERKISIVTNIIIRLKNEIEDKKQSVRNEQTTQFLAAKGAVTL